MKVRLGESVDEVGLFAHLCRLIFMFDELCINQRLLYLWRCFFLFMFHNFDAAPILAKGDERGGYVANLAGVIGQLWGCAVARAPFSLLEQLHDWLHFGRFLL